MRIVIIGAGRGARIMPYSTHHPKCFTEVNGKRILDRTLDALRPAGLEDVHFIGGYLIDVVKKEYPQFTFHHNVDWQNNNILESLLCAENVLADGFISTYSDILYTSEVVENLVQSPHDITLAVDTRWKDHYAPRTLHPMNDAEKVLLDEDKITRVSRLIPNELAPAEFIGLAKFSARGARTFIEQYRDAKSKFGGKPFREAPVFKKAYLIHLFQEMIENGIEFHCVETEGRYFEIDTVQDLNLATESLKLRQTL